MSVCKVVDAVARLAEKGKNIFTQTNGPIFEDLNKTTPPP